MNNRLESEKVSRLLMSLALPAICAQIITLIYSMADRIYVGRMDEGALAMAGIGLCSPVMSVISGITALFARGGAPLAAIAMGERDHGRAEKYIGNSFGLLAISSVVIMGAVLMFGEPLMRLFGASDQTLPYALDYMRMYVLGTVFILPAVLPWGIYAVVLAESVSDLTTTFTNVLVFRRFIKKKLG